MMLRKYWKIHPVWSRGVAKAFILLPARVVLAETHKWMKLRNTLLGTIDGFRGDWAGLTAASEFRSTGGGRNLAWRGLVTGGCHEYFNRNVYLQRQ